MKLSEIIIDKPDFDHYYESTSYPMCENNSDKIEDMTIEDFKWEICNNFFKEGIEQTLNNITPQVAIAFGKWADRTNPKNYALKNYVREYPDYTIEELFEEFLKQYNP